MILVGVAVTSRIRIPRKHNRSETRGLWHRNGCESSFAGNSGSIDAQITSTTSGSSARVMIRVPPLVVCTVSALAIKRETPQRPVDGHLPARVLSVGPEVVGRAHGGSLLEFGRAVSPTRRNARDSWRNLLKESEMGRCVRLLAIVAAAAIVGAACSDSGGSASPFGSNGAPDSAASSEDSGGVFGADGIPNELGDVLGLSDECEDIANVFLSIGSIFLGGDILEFDADTFRSLPGDLQDDAAIVADGLNAVVAGIADVGLDLSDPASLASMSEEQAAAFSELSESFDSPEFNEALENIDAYATAQCDNFPGG